MKVVRSRMVGGEGNLLWLMDPSGYIHQHMFGGGLPPN